MSFEWPDNVCMNVNFPDTQIGDISGVKVATQGDLDITWNVHKRADPVDEPYYWLHATFKNVSKTDKADMSILENKKYIAATEYYKKAINETAIIIFQPKNNPNAPISFTSPKPIASFPAIAPPTSVIIKKIPAPTIPPIKNSIPSYILNIPCINANANPTSKIHKLSLFGIICNFLSITNADISILHKTMFISPVPPGGVTYENFMKIIPYSGLLCTVNLTGGDILGMIKKVQSGENAFHPTSGLKQYVKINKEGKKEILNVEIYDKDNKPNKIDINKNYILASTDNIFNEDSFDDFQQKDVLNIIKNKLKKNLVKCSDKYLNQILYDFFLKKQIIDLSTIANDKNERIIFVK